MKKRNVLLTFLSGLAISAIAVTSAYAQSTNVKILATTDVHTQFKPYNYYTDQVDENVGLSKLATLIDEQMKIYSKDNTLYLDNGDFIQGTPFGDYMARVDKMQKNTVYPGVAVLNYLGCDAQTFGNHEFNYGLDYLQKIIRKAEYPIVNANLYNYDTTKNYVQPYTLISRKVVLDNGSVDYLTFGVIGVVPPQVKVWDNANLDKKIKAKDMVESIKKYIPEMKQKGANFIIALAHTGIGTQDAKPMSENMAYEISKINGVDIVVAGHSHLAFPSASYETMDSVDVKKGTVNGKPFVISGSYADALGVIDLKISNDKGLWEITDSKTKLLSLKENAVKEDETAKELLDEAHNATLDYIRQPIGKTESNINSFFALARDNSSIQLVNDAQIRYGKKVLKGTKYEKLPVISAAAPFKCGGRGGAGNYTNIPKGPLAVKNMSDLYVFPNTVYILKITGEDLRNWLERSAGQFNKIDPAKATEQYLINDEFPTYNFDVIDAVQYKFDLTQDSKYDKDGKLINPDAKRVAELTYDGKPVKDTDEFAIVTNNYRASGGGSFPNINLSKSIFAAPDENRQVIVNYITQQKVIDPSADMNWSFMPIENNRAHIIVKTSPKANEFAGEDFSFVEMDDNGFANYLFNLK